MNAVLNWGTEEGEQPATATPANTSAGTAKTQRKGWFKRQSKQDDDIVPATSPTPIEVGTIPTGTNAQLAGDNDESGKPKPWYRRQSKRTQDISLAVACILLVLAMNFTIGRYILYPFVLFATWVHEMCHGIAALVSGGSVDKLEIFRDGSGLAHVRVTGVQQHGFVASAGYPGTAITGFLLLLFRRIRSFPRIALVVLGILVGSCVAVVRNTFGLIVLIVEGVVLIAAGWKLPIFWLSLLFGFLAVTCCLNAFESIRYLYDYDGPHDARSVAAAWGGDYRLWATLWLFLSVAVTLIGGFCACNPKKKKDQDNEDAKANENKMEESTMSPSSHITDNRDGSSGADIEARFW